MRLGPLDAAAVLAAAACSGSVPIGERYEPFTEPPPRGLWSVIEAESHAPGAGAGARRQQGDASAGAYLAEIPSGATLVYAGVDLGAGATGIQVRLASARDGGAIAVHLDAPDGPRVGEAPIPNTGGWTNHHGIEWSNRWRTVVVPVAGAEGRRALVLALRHPAGGRVADLDFLRPLGPHRPRTYVVSPAGSDRAAGGPATPLKSIGEAVHRVRPGDTVVVRGGVYYERVFLASTSSGTPERRITIENAPGEVPVIDGAGQALGEWAALVESRADHVTLRGFEIRNASWTNGRGVHGDGDFVAIERSRIHAVEDAGLSCIDCTGFVFADNEVWDTGRSNQPPTKDGWPGAVSFFQSLDARVLRNHVHDNHGDGIKLGKDIFRAHIAGNVVADNWSMNVYLDNAHDSVVEQNLSYSTVERHVPHGKPGWGRLPGAFGVADHSWAMAIAPEWRCDNPAALTAGRGNVFRNNIAVNTRSGFSYTVQDLPCSGLKDTLVAHNTFVAQWENAVFVNETRAPNDHAGAVFRNNLLHTKGTGDPWVTVVAVANRNDTLFEHNLFYREPAPSKPIVFAAGDFDDGPALSFAEFEAQDRTEGNLWDNPRLARLGAVRGDVARGHELLPASPAVDRATPRGAPDRDFFGNARPAGPAPDIGAHELGARPPP
jgi:hypothetical protein